MNLQLNLTSTHCPQPSVVIRGTISALDATQLSQSLNAARGCLSAFQSITVGGCYRPRPVDIGHVSPALTRYEQGAFANQVAGELKSKLYNPDFATQSSLNALNCRRSFQGLAPINFQATTQRIENILNNPFLSEGAKRVEIGKVGTELRLRPSEMRSLFTDRIGNLYREASAKINNHLGVLRNNLATVERNYGSCSFQAQIARRNLDIASSILQPKANDLSSKAYTAENSRMRPSWFGWFC